MVALFSNLQEELSIPVECTSYREVNGVRFLSDNNDEMVIDFDILSSDGIYTSVEVMDYAGVGISVFTFKRHYCNG